MGKSKHCLFFRAVSAIIRETALNYFIMVAIQGERTANCNLLIKLVNHNNIHPLHCITKVLGR